MTARRKILCVFAHPDDESYGPGGTLASYALDGVELYLLMFTCGEAGSIGVSNKLPGDELCRRRRDELAGACNALGFKAHRILGVPDKGVKDISRDWAVTEIMEEIRTYEPHVLMTFHQRGVSGHPDHIAVSTYLAEAFDRSFELARPPQVLYEWGIPRRLSRLYERPNLQPMEDDEIDAVITISDAAMDRKIEAIRRHETQIDFFHSLEEKMDYREASRPEYFSRRSSRVNVDGDIVNDLFAGVTVE